jgi:hypothetical protein
MSEVIFLRRIVHGNADGLLGGIERVIPVIQLLGVDPLLHNLQRKLPQAWVPEDFV